jgi:hypothetical protein
MTRRSSDSDRPGFHADEMTAERYRELLAGAPVDEELTAAFREWWDAAPYVIDVDDRPSEVAMAQDLADLQEHLAAHGFAIVRRFLAADT